MHSNSNSIFKDRTLVAVIIILGS